MEVGKKEIHYYEKENGDIPYLLWFESFKDETVQTRIAARLDRVESGNFGDYRSVGEGVNELRFTFGKGYRVYFGMDGDNVILLLCAGDKKSQKKDIKTAQEYWKRYCSKKRH